MSLILLYGSALLLGSAHAFGPDHVAAVTVFALRRPDPRSAMGFGIRWAAGHGVIIFGVGALLVLAGAHLPSSADLLAERAAGWVLIGMGTWAVLRAPRLAHRAHHPDVRRSMHAAAHGPAAIGMLHGLAGNGTIVAIVPLAALGATAHRLGFLLAFALGTALAMAAYAFLAGLVLHRTMLASQQLARGIARSAGLLTVLIGLAWVIP